MLGSISCGICKAHAWLINKDNDVCQAGAACKAEKGKTTKRNAAAADTEDEDENGEGEVKNRAVKRAKNKEADGTTCRWTWERFDKLTSHDSAADTVQQSPSSIHAVKRPLAKSGFMKALAL
jgi:YD repeat-containing protein